MTEDKYAVTSWGNAPKPFDLNLPSGQTILVKPLQMPDILKLGIVNRLDSFSSMLVGEDESKAKKAKDRQKTKKELKQEDQARILGVLGDPEKFSDLMETMDIVIRECVLKPNIEPEPDEDEDRIDGLVYIDNVDFNDKMYIFGEVFSGMDDMSSFRRGQDNGVGNVAEVESSSSNS